MDIKEPLKFTFFKFGIALLALLDGDYLDHTFFHFGFNLVSIALIFKIHSTWLFYSFLLFQMGSVLCSPPHELGNHVIFLSIVSVYILGVSLFSYFRRADNKLMTEGIISDLKYFIVILYLLAGFHKLNSTFLNPHLSCISAVYHQFRDMFLPFFPIRPGMPIVQIGIILTLVIELICPIGLLFRPSRSLALRILVLFHLFLSLKYYEFSLMMFSFYLLFIPENLFVEMKKFYDQVFGNIRFISLAFRILLILWALSLSQYNPWRPEQTTRGWLAFSLLIVLLCFFFPIIRNLRKSSFRQNDARNKFNAWSCTIMIFLVINGLSPYFGLKTILSFSMYSNLRTELKSNHLLIPKGSLQFIDYQDDLVKVFETNISDWKIESAVRRGHYLPLFEIRRIITENLDLSQLRYIRFFRLKDRHVYNIKDIKNPGVYAELIKPLNFWEYRFFAYRSVPIDENILICQW